MNSSERGYMSWKGNSESFIIRSTFSDTNLHAFFSSEQGNKEAQLASVLSPVSRKKTGRAYVALARAHSEKYVDYLIVSFILF
jgi:hypothetical protein